MSTATTRKAPWIVVTGMNGAGTTTLQDNLAKTLPGRVKTFHIANADFVYPTIDQIAKWKDVRERDYASRLLFALDAQLTNVHIHEWREQYDVLISARGWTDNFFFGSAQGSSYEETNSLLHLDRLEKPNAIVLLSVDVAVALSRISSSLGQAGKSLFPYESSTFLKKLRREIQRFSSSLHKEHPALSWFMNIPIFEIDTTDLTPTQVCETAKAFLLNERVVADASPTASMS